MPRLVPRETERIDLDCTRPVVDAIDEACWVITPLPQTRGPIMKIPKSLSAASLALTLVLITQAQTPAFGHGAG